MMRYRSALMAGLLALAVAVCDDDGTVVQPPPTVNVAPPDVTVTVPPAASGPWHRSGDDHAAERGGRGRRHGGLRRRHERRQRRRELDLHVVRYVAVATVETTDTGCRATAVAGGGVTITAAVTKGSESTNVAAQLTVSTTTDAFILVTNVERRACHARGSQD